MFFRINEMIDTNYGIVNSIICGFILLSKRFEKLNIIFTTSNFAKKETAGMHTIGIRIGKNGNYLILCRAVNNTVKLATKTTKI